MKRFPVIFLMALPLSTVLEFITKYIYSDTDYLIWLCVLITLDTVLGVVKHWMAGDVSSNGFGEFAKKILIYSAVLVLSNALMHFTIDGAAPVYTSWFGTFSCTYMMVREALSIIENVEAIHPGFFPSWVIKRLKDFDSNDGSKIQ